MEAFGLWQSQVWKPPVHGLAFKSPSVEKINLILFSVMAAHRALSSHASARVQQGLLCGGESECMGATCILGNWMKR